MAGQGIFTSKASTFASEDISLLDPNTSYFEYYTNLRLNGSKNRALGDVLKDSRSFNNGNYLASTPNGTCVMKLDDDDSTELLYWDDSLPKKVSPKEKADIYHALIPVPEGPSLAFGQFVENNRSFFLLSSDPYFPVRSTEKEYTRDLFVKARVFKKWVIAKRRKLFEEKEEKKKLKKAIEHRRLKCLKTWFLSWRLGIVLPRMNAVALNQYHLLRRYFTAFKLIISERNKKLENFKRRKDREFKRKSFELWRKCWREKRIPILKQYFELWRKKTRLKMLEASSNHQILSKDYQKWKEQHKFQQKTTIASLHFKVNLLSNALHKWRIYAMQNRVKNRMRDVARIHHEDTILKHVFTTWKTEMKKRKDLTLKLNHNIVSQAFGKWKNWARLKRIEGQHQYLAAKEMYNLSLCKRFLLNWKCKHDFTLAMNLHDGHQKRRVFKLWHLQMTRRKLMRRLAHFHHRKLMQQRCFRKWGERLKEKEERRILFLKKLNVVHIRYCFRIWWKLTAKQKQLRENSISIETSHIGCTLRSFFEKWRHQHRIKCFIIHHQNWYRMYISRKYFMKWRRKVKKKVLRNLLPIWASIQGRIILKEKFKLWLVRKREAEDFLDHVMEMQCILEKQKATRVFQRWRVFSQEQLLIKSFDVRRNRILLARCFDGWMAYIKRKENCSELLRAKDLFAQRFVFFKWRDLTSTILAKRKQSQMHENKITQKCIDKWTEYVNLSQQRCQTSVTCYARHWLDVTQQRVLTQEIAKAEKASNEISKRVFFVKWYKQFLVGQKKRNETILIADQFYESSKLSSSFYKWLKSAQRKVRVREFMKQRERNTLSRILLSWHQTIKQDLNESIANFNQRLNVNSPCSVVSPGDLKRKSMPYITANRLTELKRHSFNAAALCNSMQLENYIAYNESDTGSIVSLGEVSGKEQLFLPDLAYDTDYELDLTYSFNGLSNQNRSEFSMIRSSSGDTENISEANSPFFQDQPKVSSHMKNTLSWTDCWKQRYRKSLNIADLRRHSHVNSGSLLTPVGSSTARSDDVALINSAVDSLRITFSPPPAIPEVLNRTLLFARKPSSDEATLLTSGVHSFDTEDDVNSVSSFRTDASMQTKHHLLVGALHHWKSLEISHVFYAWFKYSQRKKYLRGLQDFLLDKNYTYLMHQMFLRWYRELYCRQVSQEFQRKMHLSKGIQALSRNATDKRLKHERQNQADSHLRTMQLKLCFSSWKKNLQSKQKISVLLNIWKDSTKLPTNAGYITSSIVEKRNKNILRTYFAYWKQKQSQMHLAQYHYDYTLLSRFLDIWWRWMSQKQKKNIKLQSFQLEHVVSKVFLLWKRKTYCFKQVVDATKKKENDLLATMFTAWHNVVKDKVIKKRKIIAFENKRNHQLVMEAFNEWQLCHHQTLFAKHHHSVTLLSKTLLALGDVAHKKLSERRKEERFKDKSSINVLIRSFKWWKQSFHAKQKQRNCTKLYQENILSASFKCWRKKTLQSKAEKLYRSKRCKKCFENWKSQFVLRIKQQLLAKQVLKTWMQFTKKSRTNKIQLDIFLDTKNMIIVAELFDKWKTEWQQIQFYSNRRDTMLLRRVFSKWKEHSSVQTYYKECKQNFQERRNTRLMESAFVVWRELHERKKTLARIKQNLTDLLVREKGVYWKLRAKELIYTRVYHHRLEKKYFTEWKQRLHLTNSAETHYHETLERRYLRLWQSYFLMWKNTNETLARHLEMKKTKKLNDIFTKWKQMTILAKKERQVRLLTATDHFEISLTLKCFTAWRTEMWVGKLNRNRVKRITRKYFQIWLNIVIVNKTAVAMYKERVCAKYWSKWRKEFIRHKVASTMEHQSDRRVLSEVFGSWLRYSQVKRTVPKQFAQEQTQIWFRKWKTGCKLKTIEAS